MTGAGAVPFTPAAHVPAIEFPPALHEQLPPIARSRPADEGLPSGDAVVRAVEELLGLVPGDG